MREVCFLIGRGDAILWADASDSPAALPGLARALGGDLAAPRRARGDRALATRSARRRSRPRTSRRWRRSIARSASRCVTASSRRASRSRAPMAATTKLSPSRGGPACCGSLRACSERKTEHGDPQHHVPGPVGRLRARRSTTRRADADIRRIAVEVVRSGGVRGLHVAEPAARTRSTASSSIACARPDGAAADLPAPEGPVRRLRRSMTADRHLRRRRARLDARCSTAATSTAELRARRLRSRRVEEPRRAVVRQAVARQEQGRGGAAAARELLRRRRPRRSACGSRRRTPRSCSPAATSRSTASTTPTAGSRSPRRRARRACRSCTRALAADGTFGLVRWDERFTPDREDAAGPGDVRGRRAPADDRRRRGEPRARRSRTLPRPVHVTAMSSACRV